MAINIVSVQHRHHRLAYTGIVCGILLVIGLIALNFPVFLDAYDQWGFQIKCGTGYVTDLTQAAAAAGEHNYVEQCETALLMRRMWTIPLVAVSGLVVLVVTVASAIASARESLVPYRDRT
jgi:H+/Cl- antiporter ClcA